MNNLSIRWISFIMGIAINSFGIAFITKGALGTSQVSSVPYIMSLHFPAITFGMFTFIFNMLFILIQILLLKKDFKPFQFLQIGVNIIFSFLIDISMWLLSFLQPEIFITRFICMFIGCMILAFGISLEVAAKMIYVPGEGVVQAIAKVKKMKFGTVKIYFDVLLICIASILSFIFFGRLNGIGIGTIFSAISIGKFVNIISRRSKFVRRIKILSR